MVMFSFEVEDENRDGIISQDETDDPDQIFEESPLQLFDYFPSVRLDSKVDIEVETITKFEDASVTGFDWRPGTSYQVDDILIFDNAELMERCSAEFLNQWWSSTSYTFENIEELLRCFKTSVSQPGSKFLLIILLLWIHKQTVCSKTTERYWRYCHQSDGFWLWWWNSSYN